MFNQYARVLASIPRWSVVPVVRRQYVAEHSYYVSLYTAELLGLSIFDRWTDERKFACLRYALIHDAEESRMSDIPGPVKRMIKDQDKLDKVEARVLASMGYTDKYGFAWHVDEDIKAVVKAADLIDEFFYLNMESSMGSRIVTQLLVQVESRLMSALNKLPWGEQEPHMSRGTHSGAMDLFVLISEQAAQIDAGIETLTNNDDVTPDCTEEQRCGRDDCRICEGIPF